MSIYYNGITKYTDSVFGGNLCYDFLKERGLKMIHRYKPLDHIEVTQESVEKCETNLLEYLQKNTYVHLNDYLAPLSNLTLTYTKESYESEIGQLTKKISHFMEIQEALFNLMTRGKIMPVYISNVSNTNYYGLNILTIRYEEKQGMMTTSGTIQLSIPILVHNAFTLKPSLKNK